ncbi:MAG: hypothetical protein LPK26_20330 [Bacillaceae bacterium]|uniref:Nodule Cysteine-Rich (NCR) secreted peptide n=1 Tax=Alkalihalobacterium chitinilyticum TaxID=2980103 RepID=A0ABT5VI74_9BACI|nr:hypothetical protein [Alkalihalobacterium chitinilyticum]MEB1809609.1 hypothetical protein [Bacillaceae bacterium]
MTKPLLSMFTYFTIIFALARRYKINL